MHKILVTGGSGLIGKRLLADLRHRAEVASIGRHDPSITDVTWIPHDFTAPQLPKLPPDSTTVVYLAQSEHFRQFPERAQDIFDVNIASVQKMLEWARKSGV